jgi:hypothetical protein
MKFFVSSWGFLCLRHEEPGIINHLQSELESELLYDWRFTANQFVLAPNPLGPTTSISFQLNTAAIVLMQHTLWREDGFVVYNCCWPSPEQLFSGPRPARLMDHILLSQTRDCPNLVGQVPVFISLGTRWFIYTPKALCSLFVASYDSQGYDGVIRPHLHMGETEYLLNSI